MATLGEACARTGWQLYAWRFLPHHLHLAVPTPQGNLVGLVKRLLETCTGPLPPAQRCFPKLVKKYL